VRRGLRPPVLTAAAVVAIASAAVALLRLTSPSPEQPARPALQHVPDGDGSRVAVILLNGRTDGGSGDGVGVAAVRRLFCAAR